MKRDLYDLYQERINIIENNYLNKHFRREKLEKVEFKILEQYQGYELLINLKTISTSHMMLEYEDLSNQQKDFILLRIFDSIKICENILKLEDDSLLNENEIFIKFWLKFKLLFNSLKEKILLCGCNI
tara:strand:+ start:2229 stop:2612 length:384 start_codon:yes stop_codon:yes gene_type:complete